MQTLKHLSRRIIIVVTNTSKLGNSSKKTGWYLPEVAHPYFVFKRHGFNVNFVSPKGGIAPVDEQSVQQYSKDYLCSEFLHNHMHKLQNTKKVLDLDPKNYDAIFFAGGYGPMFDVSFDEDLAKFSAEIYEKNGVIGGVCHGPAGLVNIKLPSTQEYLIRKKIVTGFSNEEEEDGEIKRALPFLLEDKLKERDAVYVSGNKWEPHVKVCERVVTGQNPSSSKPTAETVVDVLKHTIPMEINFELQVNPEQNFSWLTK